MIKKIKQIALRLPMWVAEKLIGEAKQLNIPLHSLIVIILINHVKQGNRSVYEDKSLEAFEHK